MIYWASRGNWLNIWRRKYHASRTYGIKVMQERCLAVWNLYRFFSYHSSPCNLSLLHCLDLKTATAYFIKSVSSHKEFRSWDLCCGDLKRRLCLVRSTWSGKRRPTSGLRPPLLQCLLHVSPRSHWSATESWGINTPPTGFSLGALTQTWQPATTDAVKVRACFLIGPVLWNLFAVCKWWVMEGPAAVRSVH